MLLGAGRSSKEDIVDLAVGVEVLKKVGDKINEGDTLARLYSNGKNEDVVYEKVLNSYKIVDWEIKKGNLILDIIR